MEKDENSTISFRKILFCRALKKFYGSNDFRIRAECRRFKGNLQKWKGKEGKVRISYVDVGLV